MSGIATTAARSYRELLRALRRSANEVCWLCRYDEPSPAEEFFFPIISEIDNDIYSLFRVDGDDDILSILLLSKENTVNGINLDPLLELFSKSIRDIFDKFFDAISRIESTLEQSERDTIEKPHLQLVHFADARNSFARTAPIDLAFVMKPIIGVLKPKIQFPFEKLEQTAEIYAALFATKTALAALVAFEIPQPLSRNQKRILDLKEQIAVMEKAAIDKRSMLRRLQEEKRNARSENITLKRESDALKKRVEDSKQMLAQAQAKGTAIAPIRNALEHIAAIIKEPPRTKQPPQTEEK